MSSVTVLCPNAHRVVVKTTPNTSILKILEDACIKHKYNPDNYTLRHLKRLLDVTGTVRFSAIPNRCVLEMVELSSPRTAQPVTVCLIDEQGNKNISKYLPSVTLWSLLEEGKVCSSQDLNDPTLEHSIVYSMNKVCGKTALSTTTLKLLGLNSGSGSMRYSSRKLEETSTSDNKSSNEQHISKPDIQAISIPSVASSEQNAAASANSNASVMPEVIPVLMPEVIPDVHQRPELIPIQETLQNNSNNNPQDVEMADASPEINLATNENSQSFAEVVSPDVVSSSQPVPDVVRRTDDTIQPPDVLSAECSSTKPPAPVNPPTTAFSGAAYSLGSNKTEGRNVDVEGNQSNISHDLPSQLMEVDSTQDTAKITLTSQKCVVYNAREESSSGHGFEQEDNEFFQLTSQDVRRLQREYKQKVDELSEAPLLTSGLREADQQARLLATLNKFPVTQLRIHFPDELVVQACFKPTDTVQTVATFVSTLLDNEAMEFELITSYPRKPVAFDATLYGAGLVPKARLYFSTVTQTEGAILKPSVLQSIVSYVEAENALVGQRNNKSSVGLGGSSSSRQFTSAGSSSSQPSTSGAINSSNRQSSSGAASGSASQKPKWFKLGK